MSEYRRLTNRLKRMPGVTILPGLDPPPTDAELRAVANTLEDIARSSPILKAMYARASKR